MKAINPFAHTGSMVQRFSNPCGCLAARQGNPCSCGMQEICCVDPLTMLFVCSDPNNPLANTNIVNIEDVHDDGTATVIFVDESGEPQQDIFPICKTPNELEVQYDAVSGTLVTSNKEHAWNGVTADLLGTPTEDYAYVRAGKDCIRAFLYVEETPCETGTCPLSSNTPKSETNNAWWAKEGHCCEKCALGLACDGGCGCGAEEHKDENPHSEAVWYPAAKGSKKPSNAKSSWVQVIGPRQETGVLRTPGTEPDFKVKIVKVSKAADGTMKAKIHGVMSNGKVKTLRQVA